MPSTGTIVKKQPKKIDQEVTHIVTANYETTYNLINDNLETLNKLAHALLEKETLDAREIDEIINNKKRKRQPRKRKEKKED